MQVQERLVRPKEFMSILGIKNTKFYKMKKEGKFPDPILISNRYTVWPMSQVNQVVEDIKSGKLEF